jgi:hypothetical protein
MEMLEMIRELTERGKNIILYYIYIYNHVLLELTDIQDIVGSWRWVHTSTNTY